MSTVAELERLNALTQRLVPISDVQRGELIRAGDWNLLAGAVIELARFMLAEGKSDVVGDHEHVEEIDVGWLTPRLRALIEQGGLSDPVAGKRLATIERDIQKLKEQLDNLLKELGKVRVNLNDVKIGDIGREAGMVILRRKFEAQADARDEVLGLRKTLDVIEQNIGRALELGDNISVDGEIPDFKEVIGRISSLEDLRNGLTGPDGNPFDATKFEIRLAELQNKFVSQDQLDDALEDVRTQPPQDMVNALEGKLQGYVDAQLTIAIDPKLAELNNRFVNQDAFASQLSSLSADLLGQTDDNLQTALAELNQRFVNNDNFESRLAQLSGDFDKQLQDNVTSQVATQLAAALVNLDTKYITDATLNQRLGSFAVNFEGKMLNTVRGEISDTVGLELQQQGSKLFVSQKQFDTEITTIRKDIDGIRNRGLTDPTLIGRTSDSELVSEAVLNARVANLESSTLEKVSAIVKEQVDAALESSLGDIQTELERLQGLEARMLTLVSNQIDVVRQELNSRLQNLDRTLIPADTSQGSASAGPVDNFIEINGLGEAFTERLLNQGIRTFEELAALNTEELATILNTTPTNIQRWNIQDQAAKKAQEK